MSGTHRLPDCDSVERTEPAPQGDVGGERRLSLQPDQVLDRLNGGHVNALQQQLPGQDGPVELTAAETIAH
jgi:hypothetical protein